MSSTPPIRLSLREKFSSVIWKIELDAESGLIALETRNPADHTAAISALNFITGEHYFKEKSGENSWWWGLDRIYRDTILLHGYKNENSPEHRGIIALNAKTGETAWQQFSYTLDRLSSEGPVAHHSLMQPVREVLLSPETGEVLNKPVPQETEPQRDLRFPTTHPPGPWPAFIPEEIAGPLLSLTYEEKTVWSFHERRAGSFTQKLLVSENEELLLEENLAENIPKLNPEAFFMHKNYLFCIRESNYEISSYWL